MRRPTTSILLISLLLGACVGASSSQEERRWRTTAAAVAAKFDNRSRLDIRTAAGRTTTTPSPTFTPELDGAGVLIVKEYETGEGSAVTGRRASINAPILARHRLDDVADNGTENRTADEKSNDDGSDQDDGADNEGASKEKASRGSSYRLVLLTTILLGSSFIICLICRVWCKMRSNEVAFGQVDEYLSDFDGGDEESAIDIEAVSISSSLQTPRQPTPPPPTQAEEGEML